MAEKKVTTMVIEVDLECEKCHRKIKKVLCRIPQIQNQIYDKKAGTVTITVFCCSPEKVKEKITCKGGEAVRKIEIKVPDKPKTPPPPEKTAKAPEQAKTPEKTAKAPEQAKTPPTPAKAPETAKTPPPPANAPETAKTPPPPTNAPETAKTPPPPTNAPETAKTPAPVHPRTCCAECYQGISGGPCYHGHGMPGPPSYEAYGRPVYDSWGGGCGCQRSGYYVCRCEYVCEDNPSSCTIM